MPQEIDEVERRIMQLEIERQALQKEKDRARDRAARGARARARRAARERSSAMKAQWQQEKEMLGGVGKIKQEIEQARIEAEQATRRGDLAKAAEITYGRIPAARAAACARRSRRWRAADGRPQFLKEEVGGGRHRRGRGAVDRHSGVAHARERARAADEAR